MPRTNDLGWLLILDNVDSPEVAAVVQERFTRLTGGHVLVTSRLSDWSGRVEKVVLRRLDLENATEYLLDAARDRIPAADDREQAQNMAASVCCLALGLEQAAAYLNTVGVKCSDYLHVWKQSEEAILQEFDLDRIDDPHNYLVAWKLNVDRLTEPAQKLLSTLSWFASDPIPEVIFANISADCLGTEPRQALAELVRFSLVTHEPGSQSIRLHGLVQATSRHHLQENEQQESLPSLERALAWINNSFVGNPEDVHNRQRLDSLIPHVDSICHFAEKVNKTTAKHPTLRLLNDAGVLFQAKANYRKAESLLYRALAIGKASHGMDHPNVAIHFNNLAGLFRHTNRLAQAETLYRRALALLEESLGKHHPNVAGTLNNLAQLLQEMNRLEEAESLYRRALAISEATYGEDHPYVAYGLNNLAQLFKDANSLEQAELLMRRVIEILKNSDGKPDPNYAGALNNLAELLQATDRFLEAEPLYRRALAIDEEMYGISHPNVAIRLNNLATLFQATNRLANAESFYRRALAIDQQHYGDNHPYVACGLNNLAQLLQEINRLEEAESLLRRALAIDQQSYGTDHPSVARDLNNLARLLQDTNRFTEAEPLLRCALAILRNGLGNTHPKAAKVASNYRLLSKSMDLSETERN